LLLRTLGSETRSAGSLERVPKAAVGGTAKKVLGKKATDFGVVVFSFPITTGKPGVPVNNVELKRAKTRASHGDHHHNSTLLTTSHESMHNKSGLR
jgi:hypothetical protein